jgi:hypothetical protein
VALAPNDDISRAPRQHPSMLLRSTGTVIIKPRYPSVVSEHHVEYNELDNTIPVCCTARIPADVSSVKPLRCKSLALISTQLLNEFFVEAFEAKDMKAVNCT